jgi:hypothetical protein
MSKQRRKPYCTPEMRRVKLVPEEAVLGGCKTAAGDGIGTTGSCALASCVGTPDGS